MGYTDAQGRPELVVHPDIKCGVASYRHQRAEAAGRTGGEVSTPHRREGQAPTGRADEDPPAPQS